MKTNVVSFVDADWITENIEVYSLQNTKSDRGITDSGATLGLTNETIAKELATITGHQI